MSFTITLIMWIGHNSPRVNPPRQKSLWWQWFGGLFGLGVISINYYSVSRAGTTIAMAAAVLGQCLTGVILDCTGWLGIKKIKISTKKIVSLALSLFGIAIMLFWRQDGSSLNAMRYCGLGIVAGILTMIQMVYNSSFARKKGAFFSARQNVISGLFGIVLFMLLFKRSQSIEGLKSIIHIPFYTIVSGGVLACIVVVGTNIIIPKISGAASAVLLSSGQILIAVILDYLLSGIFVPSLLIGSLIMLLGIIIGEMPTRLS